MSLAPVPEGEKAFLPPLRIYPLDLTLVLGPGRERLPPFLGSTLRGLIAGGFRRMVCVTGAPGGM